MTEAQARQKLIDWANAQVGTHEGDNNWNRYAKGMQKLYGWDVQNQPWCDIFVDAGFVECFGLETGSAMTYQFPGCAGAACRYSAQYYKNHGAWYSAPEPGDQIFLYAGGDINHTGIVTAVDNGSVHTVEGNSGDTVARRLYAPGALNIAGYGRPDWALAATAEESGAPAPARPVQTEKGGAAHYDAATFAFSSHLLRQGNSGPQVANMQHLLTDHGYACGGVDGIFGPNTAAALRAFQRSAGIAVDGEWGAQSFGAMWNTK